MSNNLYSEQIISLNKLMKYIALLLVLIPMTAQAECSGLVDFLNKEHPNRILVQSYGYTLDRLVIFEQLKTSPGSKLSVVECIGHKFKTVNTFKFTTNSIADMEFSEMEGTVIVIFSVDPEKIGYIEKDGEKYTFTEGIYER